MPDDPSQDFPKPVPPRDDIVALNPGQQAQPTAPVAPPVATNDDLMLALNNVFHELTDHKVKSKSRSGVLVWGILIVMVFVAAGYAYQSLVVAPALKQTQALQAEAKAEIESTKSLTKVLLESLAAQSKTLTKTVNTKLTTLGFQELPK